MSDEFIIVSAADSGYFPLLRDLVLSIRDKATGAGAPIGVFDLGLSADQRAWLGERGVAAAEPGWDVDFPRRKQTPVIRKAQIARPFLRRYFPGYATYLWIDADAWVQEWSAVETLLAASAGGKLAICPELDRSYKRHYKRPKLLGMTLQWRCYRTAYGLRIADRLGRNPMLNCGVFALRGNSPSWDSWIAAMKIALQRTNFVFIEQIALNYAVFAGTVPATFLPATCNWLCGDAAPMWDEARQRLVEPNAPYQPLGILHLAGEGQKEKSFTLATTSGGSLTTGLRYSVPHPAAPLPG
ncbi:MAG TPA: hypothetical protein VHT04_14805, partial [Stellaceae bacterium]|jgi:hypothetical protein|nr:hypothetical protein [Stellaceae bacterium]